MARHILIACVCQKRHTVEPGAMPSIDKAHNEYKHIPDTVDKDGRVKRHDPWRPGEPLAAEPLTVECGCGYSFRVTWFVPDHIAAKTLKRTRRGHKIVVRGQRAIVEVFKDGSNVGAFSWDNDRFMDGSITIARSDKERRELEATLHATLFGDREHHPENKIAEGPAKDKRTGAALEQPSKDAHEAMLLRREIDEIDRIGAKTVKVYAYPE